MFAQDQPFPALSDPTYQIQSLLGSGGGGIVYKAWHTRLQKPVVLKQITGEGKFDPRIQRTEVDILKNLRHSYLPQIYDFITEWDSYGGVKDVYTVMEFIPGRSLADYLQDGQRFPQQLVIHWARQLCAALVYLHEQTPPVLHSDIKPANIMLTETGDICLIDFNVSLVLHEGAAQAIGRSHGYASPEQYGPEALPFDSNTSQSAPSSPTGTEIISAGNYTELLSDSGTEMIQGAAGAGNTDIVRDTAAQPFSPETQRRLDIRLDARSDIYSLGATLYHLLTGEKPAISTGKIKPLKDFKLGLSEGIVYVVEKCMHRDPAQRFQTAAQLSVAVNGIHMHDRRWKRQRLTHTLTTILLVLILAASCATAVVGYFRMGEERLTKYNELVLDISRIAETEGPNGGGSERAFNEAAALFPERVVSYYTRAKVLFDDGGYDDCIRFVRGFTASWSSYNVTEEDINMLRDMYFILAECFFEQEDFTSAAQYYEISQQFGESVPDHMRNYAITLARLGRISEAETILDELPAMQVGEDSIYLLHGEISSANGDDAAAAEWFLKALDISGDSYIRQRAYLMCAKAYQRISGHATEEIELLTAARRDLPEQLVITEQLADAYVRAASAGGPEVEEYLAQAVALFEDIRAKGLGSLRILLNIGVLYQELGNYSAARAVYNEMQSDFPDDYHVPLRVAYLTLEEQSKLPNEERDYTQTYDIYVHARELYDARPGSTGDDAEMLMLESLIAELRNNGWLE